MEEEFAMFNFPIEDKSEKIIKVIGVGGGGGNAVQHMWEEGVKNVTFLVVNTDSQVLSSNQMPNKILLGKEGLGTGGDPEKGRKIAEEYVDEIERMFDEETKMVFITSGMGGGTGTGVSPVIARVAKQKGILTVGVVTLPFKMEGRKRISVALKGMEELKKCVDSIIVINNEKLMQSDRYADMSWEEGMKKADEVLTITTKTIAEIITVQGKVNRDFNDICTVMRDGGAAMVSVAKAEGEKRLFKAMQEALNFPLIANVEKHQVKKMLYIVYSGTQNPAKIQELTEINEFMDGFSEDIEVLWGHYPDDSLGDDIKVSIVATGFDNNDCPQWKKKDEQEQLTGLYNKYYQLPNKSIAELKSQEPEESETEDGNAKTPVATSIPATVETTNEKENETHPFVSFFSSLGSKLGVFMEEQ